MYVIITIAAVVAVLSYQLYKYVTPPESLKDIPALPFFKFLACLIRGDPIDERHLNSIDGPLYAKGYARMWQQGGWELVTSEPHNIKHILNRTDIFLKGSESEKSSNKLLAQKFFGRSNVVTTDNEEWKRHRKIINPAFKKSWPVKIFAECVFDVINTIDKSSDNIVSVHDIFQRLTLDVLGKGLFSYDFGATKKGDKNAMLDTYNKVMEGLFKPIYFLLPFLEDMPWRRFYHQKNDEFRSFMNEIMQQRLKEIKSGFAKDDIISLLLKNSLEAKDDPLTEEEVINNIATFFLAGHDTTANTLTSVLYYLAKYPKIQNKVREEVIEVMGDDKEAFPTLEQQKGFNYMNCVIKETMRIITTVPSLRRYCKEDEILPNGLFVPKGTHINLQLWSLHHDPKIFPDPNVFKPERFLDPTSEQSASWMPFGGGSRLCLGINFSLMEQRIALALLLQKYDMELGPYYKGLNKPKLSSIGLIYPKDLDIKFKLRC